MYSMSLTIRKDGDRCMVEAETSEPGLAAGTRVSSEADFNLPQLQHLTFARDLDELRDYGTLLGQAVFAGDVRSVFFDTLGQVPAEDVLHVSLSVEDQELWPLRWERLCAPQSNRQDTHWEFLHLQQRTAFSLDLRSKLDRRYPTISRVGLKALVVVADLGPTRPYKLVEFDAVQTVRGIRAALGENIPCTVLASSGGNQVDGTDGLPTVDEICRQLTRDRFAILHLVCHGEFRKWEDTAEGKPKSRSDTFLYLQKSGPIDLTRRDGHVDPVSGTDLLGRLCGINPLPHLTFFCSCSSASPEAEQGLGGLGQLLVRDLAMPAVVAMTEPVPIDLANEIATEFYQQLRQHGEVDRALTKASAGQAGRTAVLIPTHFSRLAGKKLFDDDSPELTVAEWEHGLERLRLLLEQRAPILMPDFEKQERISKPALKVWRQAESGSHNSDDQRRAQDSLRDKQRDLNTLCREFLDNSFDHLAKDRPLDGPPYKGNCPFPGLGVFDKIKTGEKEEDFIPYFFGREEETKQIRDLMLSNRFVAVLGGSGSGKSSLVRAGVLPLLDNDFKETEHRELRPILFLPGRTPLAELQRQLALMPDPDVIVVDQFEELFTLDGNADAAERKEFLDQLLPLRERFLLLITMRSDFLGDCSEHDQLHQILDSGEKHIKLIQPLKGAELRRVVEKQASKAQLKFEPGLAAQLFEDLEDEPGAMPLLQHCLRQLWNYRHGSELRLSRYLCDDAQLRDHPEYKHVGGVKGAISRTAEDIYSTLSPTEQGLCSFVFEQLVHIDTDEDDPAKRRDTRRRVSISELTPDGGDTTQVRNLLHRLANATLLVIHAPQLTTEQAAHDTEVEVAHETLIRSWNRLQQWLSAARVNKHTIRRIREALDAYTATPVPENLNLGSSLPNSESLLNTHPPRLNRDQADFVRRCRDKFNADRDAKLKEAEERADLANKLKSRAYYLCVSAALVLAVMLVAGWQWGVARRANTEANERAIRLSINSALSARERGELVASAHHFHNAAEKISATDTEKKQILDLAAFQLVRNATLVATLTHDKIKGALPLDRTKRILTWGRDGVIRLWSHEGREIGSMLHDPNTEVMGAYVSPDQTQLVSWGSDSTVRLWNLGTQTPIGMPWMHRLVVGARFSLENRVVSWGSDGTISVWNEGLSNLDQSRSKQLKGEMAMNPVFSPSGRFAFAFTDKEQSVLDIQGTSSPDSSLFQSMRENGATIDGAFFITDNQLVLSNSHQKSALVSIDNATELPLPKRGVIKGCLPLDNLTLVAWTNQNEAYLLDLANSSETQQRFPHNPRSVEGALFYRERNQLVTWCKDGAICLWMLQSGTKLGEVSHAGISGACLISDGKLASWGTDGTVAIWNIAGFSPPDLIARLHHGSIVSGAMPCEGGLLSWSEKDGSARLWQMENPYAVTDQHHGVSVVESIDASTVVTLGSNLKSKTGDLKFWDFTHAQQPLLKVHDLPSLPYGTERCGKGKTLTWCRNGDIYLQTPTVSTRLRNGGFMPVRLIVSKDEAFAFAWSTEGVMSVIHVPTLTSSEVTCSSSKVYDALFTEDGSVLFCANLGVSAIPLKGKDSNDFQCNELMSKPIAGGRITASGRKVLLWNQQGTVSLWDRAQSRDLAILELHSPDISVEVSPNGKVGLVWTRDQTSLVDIENANAYPLPYHSGDINGAIVGSAFIATWRNDTIQLSQLANRSPIAELKHEKWIGGAILTEDERLLLSWSHDKSARLWDAQTGDLLMIFRHSSKVKGCRFLGTSPSFVSWSEDNSITYFPITRTNTSTLQEITGTVLDSGNRVSLKSQQKASP